MFKLKNILHNNGNYGENENEIKFKEKRENKSFLC